MFENDYLMHHGIKGQKWGVRRYQNTDGSWTAAGRARYSKGGGSRAKYGSKKKNAKYGAQLNAYDRNKVAMLNDEIDALNYDYQRSHAGAKAALASKPKAYAKLGAANLAYPGALAGLGIGGALATYMPSTKQAALAFGGGTLIGALGGAAIGSHSANKKYKKEIKSFKDEPYDPEIKRELNSLIAERNHLAPSQKNRKGRVLTKEEYSDAYNLGRNMVEGGNKHKGLVSDEIYNDYLKNTTTYGSKKNAKYGSQLDPKTAKRVEELNRQIDKENLKLQKRNARSYGYDQVSLKKAAATAAATNAAINTVSARNSGRFTADLLGMDQADINSIGRSSAVSGGLAGAGLGAVSGALKGAGIKALGKSSIGKKSREAKIQRMVAERNALDPSQASRKGRTLTEKEFNRQANAAKGATIGGSAGMATFPVSPIGAAVGAAVGSRSTKGNSYDYNDYLKNTTTYGSKKKRR